MRAEDDTPQDLADGDVLDLVRPPQGGHVAFVGARATGLCGDNAQLRADFYFPDGTFIARESRTVDLEPIDGLPGWGRADTSNIAGLANVPLCPNNTGRPLLARTLRLEVDVEDRDGITATGDATVAIRCAQPDAACRALCECECSESYDLAAGCDLPKGVRCELESP